MKVVAGTVQIVADVETTEQKERQHYAILFTKDGKARLTDHTLSKRGGILIGFEFVSDGKQMAWGVSLGKVIPGLPRRLNRNGRQ